jgi:hypothetical protein
MDLHRYPHLLAEPPGISWLRTVRDLGAAQNSLLAYAGALNDFLGSCRGEALTPTTVRRGIERGDEALPLFIRKETQLWDSPKNRKKSLRS